MRLVLTDSKVLRLRLEERILDDLGCFASSTVRSGGGLLSGCGLGLVIEASILANGVFDNNKKEVVAHDDSEL